MATPRSEADDGPQHDEEEERAAAAARLAAEQRQVGVRDRCFDQLVSWNLDRGWWWWRRRMAIPRRESPPRIPCLLAGLIWGSEELPVCLCLLQQKQEEELRRKDRLIAQVRV